MLVTADELSRTVCPKCGYRGLAPLSGGYDVRCPMCATQYAIDNITVEGANKAYTGFRGVKTTRP